MLKKYHDFFDFFFVVNCMSSDKLKSRISQTFKLKSTTETRYLFILMDALIIYTHFGNNQQALS